MSPRGCLHGLYYLFAHLFAAPLKSIANSPNLSQGSKLSARDDDDLMTNHDQSDKASSMASSQEVLEFARREELIGTIALISLPQVHSFVLVMYSQSDFATY